MANQVQIKLVKSLIGRKPKHRTIARQLGLKKINATVVHNVNPAIMGLINQIEYLLKVEECE